MSNKTKKDQDRRTFIKTASGALVAISANSILPNISLGYHKDIILGGLCEMSGPAATVGVEQSHGIKLAVDTYNRKGGILGKKIKLLMEDTESKKDVGLYKTRRLVERKGADFLTGIIYSSISMAIQPYARKKKIIFVNSGSGNDLLVTPPLCNRYFFKACSSAKGGSITVQATAKKIKGKKWYLMADNYSYGKLVIEYVTKALKLYDSNIEILGVDYTNLGETNYAPYLTKVMVKQPDVLFISQFGAGYARIIKQTRQMGLKQHLCHTFFSHADAVAAGDAILGMTCGGTFVKKNPYAPRAERICDDFKKTYGYYPGFGGGFGFNGVEAIMEAVKKAGTTEKEAVIDTMENMVYKDSIVDQKMFFRKADHLQLSGGPVVEIVKDPKYTYSQKIFDYYPVEKLEQFITPKDQTGCEKAMKRS